MFSIRQVENADNIFKFYIDKINTIFNYFNGRINRINSNVQLVIDYYDYINRNYGCFISPNIIYIYIGEIVEGSYRFFNCINHDAIVTEIIVSCIHELVHAEQALDNSMYKKDTSYKTQLELHAELVSFDYIIRNREELEYLFSFHVNFGIDNIPGMILQNINYNTYTSVFTNNDSLNKFAEIEQMYLQIFKNEGFMQNSEVSWLVTQESVDNVVFVILDVLSTHDLMLSGRPNSKIPIEELKIDASVTIKRNRLWSVDGFSKFVDIVNKYIVQYKPLKYSISIEVNDDYDEFGQLKKYGYIILRTEKDSKFINPIR